MLIPDGKQQQTLNLDHWLLVLILTTVESKQKQTSCELLSDQGPACALDLSGQTFALCADVNSFQPSNFSPTFVSSQSAWLWLSLSLSKSISFTKEKLQSVQHPILSIGSEINR